MRSLRSLRFNKGWWGEKAGILLITYRNLMVREIDLKTGGITSVVPKA